MLNVVVVVDCCLFGLFCVCLLLFFKQILLDTHSIRKYKTTNKGKEKKVMFWLMAYSTHFIYGYIASDIW